MASKSKDLITVHVTRHLPMGLGVETDQGKHGLIRLRELAWEHSPASNWREVFPIGWNGKAVPLAARKGQIQEYSLRLAFRDPWEGAQKVLKRGKMYDGIVTGIMTYGVFIEIAPGITGLLHRLQLPAWVKSSPIELFWPGDRVYVSIQDIKYDERKLSLGFPESTRRVGQKTASPAIHSTRSQQSIQHEMEKLLKQKSQRKHFVIVEDDPQQSMVISNWLRHLDQLVDVFPNAEEALSCLERTSPQIAMIDVGLPGMDGLELSRMILERWPKIRIVVTTDWARAESTMDQLDELLKERTAELLIKPLLPEDLFGLIRKADEEDLPGNDEAQNPNPEGRTLDRGGWAQSHRSRLNLLESVRSYLESDLVILFSINNPHRQVTIMDCSGNQELLNSAAISQLIYSPVRDVAEDKRTLVVSEIHSHNRDRFRYLLELYPHLAAFIGVPVKNRLFADFAIFSLARHPHPISLEQKIYVEAAALTLGTQLEQLAFHERSLLIQRSALIGHLTRGMVHEINNLVGPLHSRLDNLHMKLKKMGKAPGETKLVEFDNGAIADELLEIQNNVRKIINTTRMFGRIAAKGRNEVLRIDEIINETIHFMRDISDQSRVKITFQPPEHLLVIRNQAAALEQVLLNVLLNAVQQIAELHPEQGGAVHVSIVPPFEKGDRVVLGILVEDNGPGIHASIWERIFEAGYTTRAEGSGIGLYISWNLMEELGGRIFVKDSHILSGTTFGLEIPYHL